MAQIHDDNTIVFDDLENKAAWENAVVIENKDADFYRMCYICKFPMKKVDNVDVQFDPSFWCIDFIDVKHFSTEAENLIAIHAGCVNLRPKADCRKELKKIKKQKWIFKEQE